MTGAEDPSSTRPALLDSRGVPSAPALVWRRDSDGLSRARTDLTLALTVAIITGLITADQAREHEVAGLRILGVI